MTGLYLIAYASVAVFLAAVVIRGLRAMRMPVHLRWEIYPVAHEKGRAHYGGSYFEDLDWWTKPRHKSRISELMAMGAEILLLKGVWEHNRPLWWRSYPFHLGLYLLIAFLGLIVFGAILQAVGVDVVPGSGMIANSLDVLIRASGVAGLGLATLGSLLLLLWRLGDKEVRDYTKPAHIANLLFILAGVGTALVAFAVEDAGFYRIREFVYCLVTFKFSASETHLLPGAVVKAAIVLGCLLIAYIPLTHMAHFFLKYFTWHQIRWNDEPNLPGGALEREIMDRLGQPVTWAAPHIGADGKKTWADLATSDMPEEKTEK
jgi:nitrate reductase gamma subunit